MFVYILTNVKIHLIGNTCMFFFNEKSINQNKVLVFYSGETLVSDDIFFRAQDNSLTKTDYT